MDEDILKQARRELARQGGQARAKALTAAERKKIATRASRAAAKARTAQAKARKKAQSAIT